MQISISYQRMKLIFCVYIKFNFTITKKLHEINIIDDTYTHITCVIISLIDLK